MNESQEQNNGIANQKKDEKLQHMAIIEKKQNKIKDKTSSEESFVIVNANQIVSKRPEN